MSSTKHSKLPWSQDLESVDDGGGSYVDLLDARDEEILRLSYGTLLGQKIALADAEFIVRACNSHDDLLAELKGCVEVLEWMHAELGPHHCTVGCPDIGKKTDRALAAIAKAVQS